MTEIMRATKDGEMAYAPQNSYNRDELIKCGNGELFGKGNALLPHPPMLMFDRIVTSISNDLSTVDWCLASRTVALKWMVN